MLTVRPYVETDGPAVRDLFVRVNEELAPPGLRGAFASYVEISLRQEIDRIPDYYAERQGAFWIAEYGGKFAGMFGLEGLGNAAAELRRMYVDPAHRRRGLAHTMLLHAEHTCRQAGTPVLALSTSELQQNALAFYRKAGYRLVREETVSAQTHKTVGGDIRRFYFEKSLIGTRNAP